MLKSVLTLVLIMLLGCSRPKLPTDDGNVDFDSASLSKESSMSIARRVIGPNVLEAIPYRNKNSQHDFIAVLAKDPDSGCCPLGAKIHLLEGIGQAFQAVDTGLTTTQDKADLDLNESSSNKIEQRWGIIDVDKDGINEIFSIGFGYGSGMGQYIVYLFDQASKTVNLADISFQHGKPPKATELNIETKDKQEKYSSWLLSKSNDVIQSTGLADPKSEDVVYAQSHGDGYYKGPINVNFVDGPIDKESSGCLINSDDGYEFKSVFKGPVYGYIKSKKKHFIIYSPENIYEWIGSMVSGKNYLWLGLSVAENNYDTKKRSLVAFDKTRNELDLMYIPELSRIVCDNNSSNCETGPLPLNGKLSHSNGALYLDGDKLTVPPNVPIDEFLDAVNCKDQ